jgi:hypothetical protein
MGIAMVRLNDPDLAPGDEINVRCTDGETRVGMLSTLPLYDRKGDIPRGRALEASDDMKSPNLMSASR